MTVPSRQPLARSITTSDAHQPPDAEVAHTQISRFETQHSADLGTIAELQADVIAEQETNAVLETEVVLEHELITQLEVDRLAARDKIANLEIALVSARRIGGAVGVIMATQQVTQDEAFKVLLEASQKSQRKVRDVADAVLTIGTAAEASPPAPPTETHPHAGETARLRAPR